MYRIYIAEDDGALASLLEQFLTSWGYDCRTCQDFEKLDKDVQTWAPHLILMDVNLPGANGFCRTRQLREKTHTPILFISSLNDAASMLQGLSAGGDDYLPKPFDNALLAAKVQAMLRRAYDYAGNMDFLEWQGLEYWPGKLEAKYDTTIQLSANEGRILHILLEHKGKYVSREDIMDALWQTDCYIDENTLTVNMSRLRKDLAAIGFDGIKTKKGLGYGLVKA